MNKTDFKQILKEAGEEFENEKKERVKSFLKERLQEYEMAKATVARLEKEFKQIRKDGIKNESFLLNYDK